MNLLKSLDSDTRAPSFPCLFFWSQDTTICASICPVPLKARYSLSLEKTVSFMKLSLHFKKGLWFRDGLDVFHPRGLCDSITVNLTLLLQFVPTKHPLIWHLRKA